MTRKGCGRLFCAQIWQNLKQKAAALPMVGKAAALIKNLSEEKPPAKLVE